MPFMHRNRWELSIIAIALLICPILVTPAQAEYNPKTGKFLQRDPNETGALISAALVRNAQSQSIIAQLSAGGQYADGPNLYQYQRSNPFSSSDPSGAMTMMQLVAATAIGSTVALAALGGIRGALKAMGMARDGTPRSMAWEIVNGAAAPFGSYKTWGAVLILSAIIATGPVGIGIVGAIGVAGGMLGYAKAQFDVAKANSYEELYVASYDGVVSSVAIAAGYLTARVGWQARMAARVARDVSYPTKAGNYPSWTTVKRRYWGNDGAPKARVRVERNGRIEEITVTKELHHKNGRGGPDPHRADNLFECWPWEHASIDPSRYTGYRFIEFVEGP